MVRITAGVLVLLIGSLCRADTIYQSTDTHGNPVFTDQPQPTAKPVELKPVNTTPSVTPISRDQPSAPAFKGYGKVALDVPSSIPNGLAPVTIGIVLEPQLQPGHQWQLLLDGGQLAQGVATSASVEQMTRGPHQLLLQVIDEHGSVIGSSAPTDVFVYWPSKNR